MREKKRERNRRRKTWKMGVERGGGGERKTSNQKDMQNIYLMMKGDISCWVFSALKTHGKRL